MYLRRRTKNRLIAAGAVFVLVAGLSGAHKAVASSHSTPAQAAPTASQADQVISFARARIGCPYVWGGTGPCQSGYDCSGLVMEAFSQIGVTFGSSRPTADAEWQYGHQVTTPARGDLVFFAGGDGTASAPGHVGIVINPAKHLMIDAYMSGMPVEYDTYDLPGSKDGLAPVVGFTDPYPARGPPS